MTLLIHLGDEDFVDVAVLSNDTIGGSSM